VALFDLLALTTLTTSSAAVWDDELKNLELGRIATTQKNNGKYRT
jgi:hypothetical protein